MSGGRTPAMVAAQLSAALTTFAHSHHIKLKNIWRPMPLFLDICFIYRHRYNMEVDEEKFDTYGTVVRLGFACGFVTCGLEVVLKLGCIGAGLM
jgi:hypothetical protein